jgi:selenocysteine-specific translation elongation factor
VTLRRNRSGPPAGPFRFVLENAFVVPLRGVVVVGSVTEGTVVLGADAVALLPAGPREVTVRRIEVGRRKATVAGAGDQAGLYLDGLTAADLPTVPGAGGAVLDGAALAGVVVTSRG